MVHKSKKILTEEDKEEYERGFKYGVKDGDVPLKDILFTNIYFQKGWNDGQSYRKEKEPKELKLLRKKLQKNI